jgi:hypothetical protein
LACLIRNSTLSMGVHHAGLGARDLVAKPSRSQVWGKVGANPPEPALAWRRVLYPLGARRFAA